MIASRKEIRDVCLSTTRQENAQIGSLVNEFINLTLSEINEPAWISKQQSAHSWSFLRRKTTFPTVASTSDYVFARDIDKIALIRQIETPIKLTQLTDENFFRYVPNPTDTGNPRFYRIWETEGVATRLATADTLNVTSDSASDAGNSELSVSIQGYDSSGIWITETFQLNGTSAVTGAKTFAAREIFVSKQKNTTGTITVSRATGSTVLVRLGPNDRAPKFKIVSFNPIPSSVITMYAEFYTFIPSLNNDSDVPLIPEKFLYVVRLGVLSKIFQYLNKENDFNTTQALFAGGVRSMVASDNVNVDLIEYLAPERSAFYPMFFRVHRSQDLVA